MERGRKRFPTESLKVEEEEEEEEQIAMGNTVYCSLEEK